MPFTTCGFCASSCSPGHCRFFSAEIARNSLAKTASLTVSFSGNFNVFHGTGTDQKSRACQAEMRGAREKHHVSTGTLGTQIKPTPAEAYRVHLEWALSRLDRWGNPISFSGAATKLNEQQLDSPMGGHWSWRTVRDMAQRLGFSSRLGYVPTDVLQARAQAIFAQHPESTAQQLIAKLSLGYAVGIVRAGAVARRCRESAAKHSWAQRRIQWPVDRHTVTRIRISEIWKRHPEFSGRQVIEKLGTEHRVRLPWVQKILSDCWKASARHNAEQQRIGRRNVRSSRR